ncbi:MAG: CAP domain-containing protein [Oscillospiraceae bacterium]|jgi:uncharacterized protein YkwD|nr:CAP domain-containing protein [Oscillospiraceae bacterium]
MRNTRWIAGMALTALAAMTAAGGALADTRRYYSVPDGTSQQQIQTNYYKPEHGTRITDSSSGVAWTWSDNQNGWVCTQPEEQGAIVDGVYYSGDGPSGGQSSVAESDLWQDALIDDTNLNGEVNCPSAVGSYEYYPAQTASQAYPSQTLAESVYVPDGAALSQTNTQCENLPSAYSFTINGVPITVTNAAYSKNGVSQIYSPANNTQLPSYGTANGSGVTEYPAYPQTQQTAQTPQTQQAATAATQAACLSGSGYFGQCATGTSCVLNGQPCVIGVCPNNGYCPSNTTADSASPSNTYQYPTYTTAQTTSIQQTGGILSEAEPATAAIAGMEQESLALLNYERQVNGLTALQMDPTLNILARLKSQDMAENNYFDHESETYGKAADMLDAAGYSYSGVGENIAHHEDVYTANNAFMSSAGHRANILGSQWTKAGVGVALDSNGYPLITQIFAR